MSGSRLKLDLDSILQMDGFLTILRSGDLLNFGNAEEEKHFIVKFRAAAHLHLVDIKYKQSNRCTALLFSSLNERSRMMKQIIFNNNEVM